MISKMTSSGKMEEDDGCEDDIFVISVNVIHTSGHDDVSNNKNKKNVW